jgi:hypothetical protein
MHGLAKVLPGFLAVSLERCKLVELGVGLGANGFDFA